jgi:hypothetical protein
MKTALWPAQDCEDDRRKESRRQIGNSVVNVDLGDSTLLACCLWDASTKGACLLVPQHVEFPHFFKIKVEREWRIATVVWRQSLQVGVQFVI